MFLFPSSIAEPKDKQPQTLRFMNQYNRLLRVYYRIGLAALIGLTIVFIASIASDIVQR